jgi:hypothetical protein
MKEDSEWNKSGRRVEQEQKKIKKVSYLSAKNSLKKIGRIEIFEH